MHGFCDIKILKLYLKTSVSKTLNAHWLLNELPTCHTRHLQPLWDIGGVK